VPLFQEQAMQIAIVGAGFAPERADQLRRAMATFRHVGTIQGFREEFVAGMARNGYEPEFAERCFGQIEGFGTYGFPRATPPPSRSSSTSPPGSSATTPPPSPRRC
jgi:DNA polymerase III alpha subunit